MPETESPILLTDAAEFVGRNDAVDGRSDPVGQAGRLLDPRFPSVPAYASLIWPPSTAGKKFPGRVRVRGPNDRDAGKP